MKKPIDSVLKKILFVSTMAERQVHEIIHELSTLLVERSENILLALEHTLHRSKEQKIKEIVNSSSFELYLEERCLTFLALQQPVAKDLRSIVTIIKINDELTYINELVSNIAYRLTEVHCDMVESFQFENMAMSAKEMIAQSLEAFITKDSALAMHVTAMDDSIDAIHRNICNHASAMMKHPTADIDQLIAIMSISRYIERMADHACRIADEVFYLVTGSLVRHNEWHYTQLLRIAPSSYQCDE